MKLSTVIPCYNEEGNIPALWQAVISTIKDTNIEVIFVNNGSFDNSSKIFLQQNPHSQVKVLNLEQNQGYGGGILAGLDIATGDLLAWTHADLQTDFADILTAYDLYIKNQNDLVLIKGKRKNRALMEAFFTFGMQLFVQLVLKVKLDDINAQPKMFSKDFYSKFIKNKAPKDFSLDLYLLYMAKKNNYNILSFPVFFKKRLHGEAKGGGSFKTKFNLIKRTINLILRLKQELKS